jgi:hypothetical protein
LKHSVNAFCRLPRQCGAGKRYARRPFVAWPVGSVPSSITIVAHAAELAERIRNARDALAGDRRINNDRERFMREIVDDRTCSKSCVVPEV